MRFPSKKCDFHSYVRLPEGKSPVVECYGYDCYNINSNELTTVTSQFHDVEDWGIFPSMFDDTRGYENLPDVTT